MGIHDNHFKSDGAFNANGRLTARAATFMNCFLFPTSVMTLFCTSSLKFACLARLNASSADTSPPSSGSTILSAKMESLVLSTTCGQASSSSMRACALPPCNPQGSSLIRLGSAAKAAVNTVSVALVGSDAKEIVEACDAASSPSPSLSASSTASEENCIENEDGVTSSFRLGKLSELREAMKSSMAERSMESSMLDMNVATKVQLK